jgi:hypothetical protein
MPPRTAPDVIYPPRMTDPDGDLGFTFRSRRGGEVQILHRGRLAATLRARDAEAFEAEVAGCTPADQQQLMARLTGNYRHGNERQAAEHPRNRR